MDAFRHHLSGGAGGRTWLVAVHGDVAQLELRDHWMGQDALHVRLEARATKVAGSLTRVEVRTAQARDAAGSWAEMDFDALDGPVELELFRVERAPNVGPPDQFTNEHVDLIVLVDDDAFPPEGGRADVWRRILLALDRAKCERVGVDEWERERAGD